MASEALKSGQTAMKDRLSGQTTFFDILGADDSGMADIEIKAPDIPELPEKELLLAEKEVFGFYLTGDPFNAVAPLGRVFSTHSLPSLADAQDGQSCRIAGILTGCKKHLTKKGDTMAFLTIEADNASVDVTIFPKSYEEYHHLLKIDEPLFMIVQTQLVDGTIKVNVEKILVLDDFNAEGFSKIALVIPPPTANRDNYRQLLGILQKNPGQLPFSLKIHLPEGGKVGLKPPSRFRISLSPGLIKNWEKVCGKNTIKIEFPQLEMLTRKNFRPRRNFRAAEG
jgi:DNA polymerase-3 subunit alpha